MSKFIGFALLLLSFNSYAGFSAVVIAYGSGDVPVNSSIDVEAEYVAMSVSLSSDAKYASERAKLIERLQDSIRSAASKSENIEYRQGVISLSPKEKSSFSISNSYGRNTGSKFYLLSKLGNGKDIYLATQDIYKFIYRIKRPEDTSLNLGNTSLAISEPSKYRNQLLEKIKSEIKATRNALGSNYKVSISGLENPVIVRQKNDSIVTLFIDYQVQFGE